MLGKKRLLHDHQLRDYLLHDYAGAVIAAMFILGVLLPSLSRFGLWFDEIFSVVMSRNIDSIINMVSTQENNMLLHYLFLWLWQPLGDGSEFYLRSSSIIFVLLALLPLCAAAKRLWNQSVAHIVPVLFVSHFLVLEHARSCRGYALALFISALVCWRWAIAWHSDRLRDWIVVGALAGLAVWSHYFAILIVPVLLFAMGWCRGWQLPWRSLSWAALVFAVLAAPIFLTRPPDGAAQLGWANVPDLAAIIGTLWLLLGSNGLSDKWLLAAAWLSGLAWCAWRYWRNPERTSLYSLEMGLSLGLIVVVALVLLESVLAQPVFVYRFFAPLVPIYCLVFAVVLARLWPFWRGLLMVLLLLTAGYETWRFYAVNAVPSRFWWRPAVQHLVQRMQTEDVVLVYPTFLRMPVDYYLDQFDARRHLPRPQEYASAPYRLGGGVESAPDWQYLQMLSEKPVRVWLIAAEQQTAAWVRLQRTQLPAIRTLLARNHQLAYDAHYDTMSMQRYDPVPVARSTTDE